MVGLSELPHGGARDVVAAAFPHVAESWLDLSTGINPHPYRRAEILPEWLEHLPTNKQFDDCRAAMASAWEAPVEAVCPVPGSEMAIRHLPLLLRAQVVGLARHSYASHRQAWELSGSRLVYDDDPLSLAGEVDLLALVNPDNPTGRLYKRAEVETALARLRQNGGTLVVDEAYMDLSPEHSLCALAGEPGLVVLRSTGKFYGLAGLRLAALLADPLLLNRWRDFAGDWSVSTPALELGARIYRDVGWADGMRSRLTEEADRFHRALQRAGLEIAGAVPLFALVRVERAHDAWWRLAARGVYVRAWPEHEDLLRIGLPADDAQVQRLIKALG